MQIKKSMKTSFSILMTTIFISIIFQIGLFAPKYAYASPQISYTNFQSASFKAAAYGNNTYVAVGYKGATAVSSDALSWSYSTPNNSFNFSDVIFANNLFVAVGENGVIKTSSDGITWTSQSSGTTVGLDKIVYTGTEFYIVGYSSDTTTSPTTDSGVVLKSSNGTTWTPVDIGGSNKAINSIAYGNSTIAITDYSGNVYYSSNNGSSWSKTIINNSINFITFLHDRFYIGTTSAYLYYSTNAASWTNVGNPFRSVATGGCSQPFCGLYDGSKYYMFGFDISSSSYGGIMTSTDGTSFTSQHNYQNSTMGASGCLYANGKYIQCGGQGIRVSTDGTNWRYATATGKFNSVVFDGSNYVSVGDASISTGATTFSTSSDGTIYKSSDFSKWTMCDLPLVNTLKSIAYGNGKYVAVGLSNNGTNGGIVESSNSTDWSVSSSPNAEGSFGLTSVVYANNLFVAVGAKGSIITSSDGGHTWSSAHSGSTYTLNFVDYINGQFVACGNGGNVLYSTDGTSWTASSTGDTYETFYGVAYGSGKYVLVGQKSSRAMSVTSSDLTTYSEVQTDSDSSYLISYKGVKYQDGSFVAFGNIPSSAAANPNEAYLSVSSDGTNWTKYDGGFAKPIYGINYINSKFRVVGYDGLSLSANLAVSSAPTATTGSANSITATGATLNGTVNANNAAATVTFEYGTTTAYGNTVTASQSPVTGNSATSVSAAVSGLSPNTTYYYRVTAANAEGTTSGSEGSFTTLAGDSSINPSTTNFDKNTAKQADVAVTMTLNGNTLSSIANGGTTLANGTDYTVSGDTVTINKSYLASQSTGTTDLTFNFSAGSSQSLAIDISDTTPCNSTISPTAASFDKNTANQADVAVTMTLNGNTLSSITNAGASLISGTDYTVNSNTVTIKKSYLKSQSTGTTNLTFNFSAGSSQSLAITVSDTTPGNSAISPTVASFDKNTAKQADVAATMTLNGNTLSSITNAGTPLISGTDYTVSSSTVTIKKSYLASQSTGTTNLTFNFSAGNSQGFAIHVSDTTPSNSTISPTAASFDKNTANQADVAVTMTLNGNTLSSITNAGTPLISGFDYSVSSNTVTIKKSYLASQSTGTTNLTFNFSAGNSQGFAIDVSDTTPSNSTISPTAASFDKNTANQADVAVTMALNGNTISSIINAGTPLISGTDYTVSSSTVTIKKSYLAALSTGTAALTFNFSAGSSQNLAITVSDTTPGNSAISPTAASFDKNTAKQADVAATMTLNGNTLSSITNAGTPLISGFDYSVSSNTVTIKKSYLAALSTGTAALTFNFSAGSSQNLAITVSDTTPGNSAISPTAASFDKNTAKQADVAATMTLSGNILSSITNAGKTLIRGFDYSVSGNIVTIKKSYLASQSTGTTNLTFNFSAGSSQNLAITVSDTTPGNSTISQTTASFDKNTANQADVAVTMSLNGNTLSSISNAGTPLANGTDYIISGNTVTIKKSYLANRSTGTTSLIFNFSTGNPQNLAISVTDTTSFTVTFIDYDGSTIGTSQTVTYGNSAAAPIAPTREGYKFTCWDKVYNNVTSNLVVTAQYSINQYTLTYTAGANGSITGAANQTVNWETAGTEVTAVPDTGYHFVSWSDFVTSASRKDTNVIASKSVAAQFAINNYNVSYDSQGGSTATGTTADYGTKITSPVMPTKTGYTFGSWYKEAACENEWNFAKDTITADTTLYAKWTINSYTVTFKDYDGSTIGTPQTVTYGSSALAPSNPARTGYVFAGWDKVFSKVTGDLVIKATYTSGNTYNFTPAATSSNAAETQAPADYLKSRDNTLVVNNNVADLSIPASAIDITNITGSGYIKVTEKVVNDAATGTMQLFSNLPNDVQMVGSPLSLNIQLFDSNDKLIKDIHQFANNQKVKVAIKLTSDKIKGLDTSKLSMYYYDETSKTWVELGGSFNTDTMEFVFYTPHFTNFAIMQKVSALSTADSTISNSAASSVSSSTKKILPKTGSLIDINVIFGIGTILIVLGALILRKRKIN